MYYYALCVGNRRKAENLDLKIRLSGKVVFVLPKDVFSHIDYNYKILYALWSFILVSAQLIYVGSSEAFAFFLIQLLSYIA